MSAIEVNTGAPTWTFKTPTGNEIRSAPAVDSVGNAIFGANDGNLYTLNTAGALTSTVALSGNLTSPAVANNQTYIASSSGTLYSGTLYDVAEPNGVAVSSPAYDPAADIVVVGDLSGAVTAFASSTGAQLWKVAVGGDVTAYPAIASGVVYIGAHNNTFYALSETTGTLKWKYVADSPIVGGAAVFPTGQITFGSENGTLYELNPDGSLV